MRFIVAFFLILPLFAGAQQDPEAKKVLDAFSKKAKSYKSYQLLFAINVENKQSGETNDNKGNLLVMGNKYKLDINGTQIFFDGKNIYNYVIKSNEVSISLPNKKDDQNILNDPAKLFDLYTKDFKYRLMGTLVLANKECYEVDLYPNDLNKKYSIVKLLIATENSEFVSAKLIMKSGVNYTLNVLKFTPNFPVSETDFTFDVRKYPKVEIIDLR